MKYAWLLVFILCTYIPLMGQTSPESPGSSDMTYVVPDGNFDLNEDRLIVRGDTMYYTDNQGWVNHYWTSSRDTQAIVDNRSEEGIYIEIRETEAIKQGKEGYQVVIPKK